jgi:uncharacterized OB-fold protein
VAELPVKSELGAPFWAGAEEGRFLLQACDCGARIFPPRVVCPKCWAGELRWEQASGLATVYSFSVLERPPTEAFADLVPYVVAMVDLDEGPRMMTNIVGCPPPEVTVGMRVRVEFDEGRGWIPLFRPLDGEAA